VTFGPEFEEPRPLRDGSSDAVTIAFSDADADVCGVARVGLAQSEGTRTASGLALLFAGGGPVAVRAQGGGEPAGDGWAGAAAAGVSTEVIEPLEAWRVSFADEQHRNGFALDLRAIAPPAELPASDPAGKLGGMEGYEQLVAVEGVVTVDGTERRFRGQGQRGHSWGAPDWDRLAVARTLGVWFEDGTGLTATAVRPAKATSHADEAIHAVLLGHAGEDDGHISPIPIADPRLSTTYDADGRQRRSGLELYINADDDFAHRAAGEVACGTTLDLGRLRLDCAFFRWRMEGRTGVGRYDLLRRVDLA
jgi:hypothetical protein